MQHLLFPTRSGTALIAVGDPSRDRTVYATIVLLVALGFTMIMLAVWVFRNTRPDPEVLAPLERMGDRKWRRADPVWQRRHLDGVRPGGADPLEPSIAPPDTDADFERGPQPIGFDDLAVSGSADDAVVSDLPAPEPGTIPVDGPVDVDTADAAADDAAPDAEADVDLVAEPDAESVDSSVDAEAGDGSDGDGEDEDEDEDDEDVTGEQDTDEFFAVLDRGRDATPDVDPAASEDDEPR